MQDRPLRDDEYPDDEDRPAYRTDGMVDTLGQELGSTAFVERYRMPECRQTFMGGVYLEPERFDRFYFEVRPAVLVDILPDFMPDDLEAARAGKHVAFKTAWCEQHDRRYLAVPQSVADDPTLLRGLLSGAPDVEDVAATPRKRGGPTQARGQISRPKASV